MKRTPPFFLFIVIAAAIFRLTNLEVIEFKADEGINLFLASRPLFGHPFPPGGTVSSIGILNPPFLNYLLFPIVLITLDPKIISFFIGLLNSLTIGFYFLMIRRYYGFVTAFGASILLAFSPWAILFSRKIWAQNFLLIFLIPWIYSLHKIILEEKRVFWAVYIAFSLFLIQLHQASILFIFLATLFILLKRTKISFVYAALGFLIGILPLIPYLIYIAMNIRSDPSAFLVPKERFSPQYFPLTFFRPLQIVGQGNFHFILGGDMLTFAQNFPLIYKLRQIFYLEYLILPLGMFLFWKNFPKFRFLTYLAVGLPFLYFLLHFEPFMHYFVILTPFLFLFLAFGLSLFLNHKNIILKSATFLLLFLIIVTSVTFNFAFFSLLRAQKVLKGDYGTSFTVVEQSAKQRFKEYQYDKNYQEMLLASFIPQHLVYGNLPVAKMIYPPNETQKRLLLLDERLKRVPLDPSVQNELLAFYTSVPPDTKTTALLRRKAYELHGYRPIYDGVYRFYLEQNFKKVYAHPDFGFAFEYPADWILEEHPKEKIIATNKMYSLSIGVIPKLRKQASVFSAKENYDFYQVKILNQDVAKKICKTQESGWCGTYYDPIQIGNYRYEIIYSVVATPDSKFQPDQNKNLEKAVKLMDQIVASLRPEPVRY